MPKIVQFERKAKTSSGYKMRARGKRGEIQLYGVVGQTFWSDGVSAKQFSKDLKALGAVSEIDLRINSEGGDVFEGRTIYSLLSEHKARITVHVDGLAASIASLIAMAGNEIIMGDGTFMMIHKAWGVAIGNDGEMDRVRQLLTSVDSTLIDTYVARTKNERKKVEEWMADETWMTANEAVENGFADKVSEPVQVAAIVTNPSAFSKLPTPLRKNRAAAHLALEQISAFRASAIGS